MIIAIDFDGTLVNHAYPKIGEEVPHALSSCKRWQMVYGAQLILWTCRAGSELQEAVDFCAEQNLLFWGVNENPDQHTWMREVGPKIFAHVYIDDTSLGVPLTHMPDAVPGDRLVVDWNQLNRRMAPEFAREASRAGS